jgi:hypothetical protein
MQEARRFLENRGTAQRFYKNMLVFIAPDANDAEALRSGVREFLAWQSIDDEHEALNLDAQQRKQAATALEKADETVDLRVRAAYNWLLVPAQPDPLGPIEFQSSKISGDDNFYDRAARKLRNDGLLIYEWSPDILRMELDRYVWSEEKGWEIGLKQLWEYLAQYCYFPRLFDHEVLVKAVRDGVGRLDAPFAYATGKSEEGHHTGLVFRSLGQVYFDNASIIVHPDYVVEPPELEKLIIPEEEEAAGGEEATEGEKPQKQVLSRYYGRVEIDPKRVNKDMGLIVEEVVERLTSQVGCEVEVAVEINAKRPEGFDESTVRTISENSRTLKFEHYGFEEG